ncbi:GNAT family N-acetyltransferase [Vagococcus sp. PNs007]|uniref:GNAT family N-acetyltransferase n=1 Tax=Vagococcus proximus TaxID=2991417 RepID=A0ABT5WYX4_9ENTE|nr:GNAT family N-acetyltransferase [Vagococcus proximus]MDF0478965.1 GNAT family N-acetyltransferase [Vagococcus proximus]
MTYKILNLDEDKSLHKKAAEWFSSKWNLDAAIYLESISSTELIPSWFVVLDEAKNKIVAGAGVISNDFHDRPDLTPNLCALYVEEDYRGKRISERLIDEIGHYLNSQGIETLYLITDHVGLYEKYGWEFNTMVKEDETEQSIRLYEKTLNLI